MNSSEKNAHVAGDGGPTNETQKEPPEAAGATPTWIAGEHEVTNTVADTTSLSGDQTLLGAALNYGEQGLAIFPLHNPQSDASCSCGEAACGKKTGKHPRTTNGLKAATTDNDQIRKWWSAWPDANIGLPTGAANGIVIIDVDRAEGEASLRQMTEKYGPLPATKKVKTGNGYQLYFNHPGGKVKSKAPLCAAYPHVDSRGDGGYVVAPPSLHYSGVRYAVDPTMPQTLADLPPWLNDLINGDRKIQTTQSVSAANDSIPEGSRNATLASKAGSLRRGGKTQAEIETELLATNSRECNPPLPEDEVRGIARSISNYAPGSPNDVLRTLTDTGNAERFANQWGGDVRYVPELGKWLIWNTRYWQVDDTGGVVEMAKKSAFAIYCEGDNVNDSNIRDKIAGHSKVSQQAPRLEAMVKLAKSIPRLVVRNAALNADAWSLGVANGTLDLRTGDLREPVRENYITMVSPVTFVPGARCPEFLSFLDRIVGGAPELMAYWQRIFGYTLTGHTYEQCLFFLYGTGANGKSTLLNLMKELLGRELCLQTPPETIMARPNKTGANHELAYLKSARAVLTNEVEDGSWLAESLVKQMTGGDPITARHLYQEAFEYIPSYKLFIAGNHRPVIRNNDDGIWRRIQLIPFPVTIPVEERDDQLGARLRIELPGILNWALVGARAWQELGLMPPAVVLDAVTDYREDMDLLGQWLATSCDTGPELTIGAWEVFQSYQTWAERSGHKPWSNSVFGRKLKARFAWRRTTTGIVYLGVGMKRPPGEVGQMAVQKAKVVM